MGQRRIVIDLTEYQARILRLAVRRLHMTAPVRLRTRMFSQKLAELHEIVTEVTADLPEVPGVIVDKPVLNELPKTHPAYRRRSRRGGFSF